MFLPALALVLLAAGEPADTVDVGSTLQVEPQVLTLLGSDASGQIVVTDRSPRGREVDRTGSAIYESQNPDIASVEPDGHVRPRADGETAVIVRSGQRTASVRVVVTDYANTRPVHFATDVVPIFTKLGCNAGGCHGKASGQNGFRLSLLGFDPNFDYDALVREGRGRRTFPARPEASLLLLKPTATIPHGGGRQLELGSPEYNTLLRWVRQGMPAAGGKQPVLTRITVSPARRLIDRKGRQQLRVVATYDDGTEADVTRMAQYQSNVADLAAVDDRGVVTALDGVGEAAIMARYGGQVAVARALVPLGTETPAWEPPASHNLIDPLVFAKLKELGLSPSEACTDAEFARRSSLDICGVLPRPEDVITFEQDPSPEKRTHWVDRLLDRPEYADHFAMKWSAILRNKRVLFLGPAMDSTTFAFHAWIRQAIAEDKPYDEFASQIVAARGDAAVHPAVVWYRPQNAANDEKVDDTAQLFLGLRIQCARCHHHPFEKWSQDDYYGFAAFFARVGTKQGNDPFTPRIFTKASGKARNPTNGRNYEPKAFDAPELSDLGPYQDPRVELARWMRRPDNPFFAKALVNRYWKHFFGRGLVEPEDDMRASNPPSNPELLDALAADFIQHGYSLKHLVRTLATSRAYDRSSLPNDDNAVDRQNFARSYTRRLPAEVLLDAINAITGSEERFNGLPKGFRAVQLPDEGFSSYFLEVFGRPKRESVCECERSVEASLSQSLHLLNSGEMQQKLAGNEGRAARWAADKRPDAEKIEELYRLCYARAPTDDERDVCLAHLARRRAENQLRQGYEDLLWTLINTKEFQLNH